MNCHWCKKKIKLFDRHYVDHRLIERYTILGRSILYKYCGRECMINHFHRLKSLHEPLLPKTNQISVDD